MSSSCTFNTNEAGWLSLGGELSFESTPALFQDTTALLGGSNTPDTVDLANITGVDSAGLALLLEWQAQQTRRGRPLKIINAPQNLISLARLCEAIDLLQLSGRENS